MATELLDPKALRAKIDALARRRQEIDDESTTLAAALEQATKDEAVRIAATRPAVVKLLIDASERDKSNEDSLSIRLLKLNRWAQPSDQHDGATGEDFDKCRAFPQKTYVNKTDEYIVPLTDANVTHLLNSWKPDEYQLLLGAKLMLEVYFGTLRSQGKHLDERAAFMESGVIPQLDDYLYADNGKPPMAHQKVGFSSTRHANFFSLIMDPGTGKSRIMVDTICDRARKMRRAWIIAHGQPCEGFDPQTADVNEAWQDGAEYAPQLRVMIICPRNVLRTWTQQLAEWATVDVNVETLRGTKLQRAGLLGTLLSDKATPILVALINYEGVEVIEEYLVPIDRTPIWDVIIADESWKIKNPSAQISKAAYRIAEVGKSRFILNGTPISKNILDLYGQYHFLKPGLLGYTTFSSFESYYGEKNFFGGHSTPNKTKLPELQEKLARCSLVVKKSQCPDLPPEVYATLNPEMGDEQRRAYEQMAERMIVDLDRVEAGETLNTEEAVDHELKLLLGDVDDSRAVSVTIVLTRMLRLAQITSGFLKMDDGSIRHFAKQPKLDALEEHLAELQDDQRIVIWSRFRPEIDAVVKRFKDEYGAVALYGGVPDRIRNMRLDAHIKGHRIEGNKSATRLVVIQPQSGAAGMNDLIGTTDVNYLSNEWSYLLRKQSADRTHRMGVRCSVLYNDYLISNTIDELIWAKLQAKKDLSEMVTDPRGLASSLRAQLAAMKGEA